LLLHPGLGHQLAASSRAVSPCTSKHRQLLGSAPARSESRCSPARIQQLPALAADAAHFAECLRGRLRRRLRARSRARTCAVVHQEAWAAQASLGGQPGRASRAGVQAAVSGSCSPPGGDHGRLPPGHGSQDPLEAGQQPAPEGQHQRGSGEPSPLAPGWLVAWSPAAAPAVAPAGGMGLQPQPPGTCSPAQATTARRRCATPALTESCRSRAHETALLSSSAGSMGAPEPWLVGRRAVQAGPRRQRSQLRSNRVTRLFNGTKASPS